MLYTWVPLTDRRNPAADPSVVTALASGESPTVEALPTGTPGSLDRRIASCDLLQTAGGLPPHGNAHCGRLPCYRF
jgi:hypothetical protein